MAVTTRIETDFGDKRDVYIRLNNVEVSNHGVEATALFRGFANEAASRGGKRYLWEREIVFAADVALPIWPQAYAALRGFDPVLPVEIELAQADEAIEVEGLEVKRLEAEAAKKSPDAQEHKAAAERGRGKIAMIEDDRAKLRERVKAAQALKKALTGAADA